jgi:signal transduction histidine kinase
MSAVSVPRPMGGHDSPAGTDPGVARLSHDVRQYVAAGLLLSGAVASGPVDDHAEARRMSLIHQQFLAIAELLDAEQQAQAWIGAVNLTELVAECIDTVRLTHGVPVMSERMTRVLVNGNRALLRRAVGNLLDNACRAAGSDGRVTVRVRSGPDGQACVEISDNGPGFGNVEPGSGLGLQAVAKVVKVCPGRLEITSGPDAGTTVRLWIPAGRCAMRSA